MTKLLENNRYLSLMLIALAIVLGVGVICLTGVNKIDFIDSDDYLLAARHLLQNSAYPDCLRLPFFRPPLYPLFIASIWSVLPGSILAIKLAQVVLHGLTCWLLFKTAYLLTENRVISFLGALVFTVNPIFLYNAAALQSEVLDTLFVTLVLFLFIRMIVTGKTDLKNALYVGVALGLAALCKPSALGVGIILAAAFFVLMFRKKGSLAASALMVAVMFLTVLPWTLYISRSKGEFILINDAGGFNLWLGNNISWIPFFEGNFSSNEEADAYEESIVKQRQDQIAAWEAAYGYSNLSSTEREKLWQAKAIENIRQDPGLTARLLLLKLWIFWRPFTSPYAYSTSKVVLSALVMAPLYLFGLLGLWTALRDERSRKAAWLFIVLTVAVTAIHVVIISSMRLRLPYIDPLLSVFAGIGLAAIVMKLVARWKFLPTGFMPGRQAAQ
jgi:hypothetical protein